MGLDPATALEKGDSGALASAQEAKDSIVRGDAGSHKAIGQRLVKSGDTLSGIARENMDKGTSEKDVREYVKIIAKDNRSINPNELQAGTMLTLRPFERAQPVEMTEAPPHAGSNYLVQNGDTLWKISQRALGEEAPRETVTRYILDTQKLNNLRSADKIQAGSILKLPVVPGQSDGGAATSPGDGTEDIGDLETSSDIELSTAFETDNEAEPEESRKPDPAVEKLSELMDKHYADPASFNDSEISEETRKMLDEQTGREHLRDLAKQHGLDVDKSIELIEQRITKNEVSAQEIEKTYRQVEKLLETESTKGVTKEQREILAQQILAQTANPTRIDQGNHNTCNVNAVECRIYTREPSHAARMVTDLALTGEYLAEDGSTRVKLNPGPIDVKGTDVPVDDGLRSYASELFQVCAVNVHYVKDGKGIWYEQLPLDKKASDDDTGERLHDPSTTKVRSDPALVDNALIGIYNSITGKSGGDGFVICHKLYVCGSDKGLTTISSEADLLYKLQSTPASEYPLILGVHTGNEPFWTDSGSGSAGGAGGDSGGGHFVTVREFILGPPPRVVLDNQWGRTRDHVTDASALSVRDLYFTMRLPEFTAEELERTLTNDRNHGQRNAWYDLELQRIKAKHHLASPRAIEMDVINVIAERLNVNSIAEDWERAAGLDRMEGVLSHLPNDNKIRIRQEQHRVGLISAEDLRVYIVEYSRPDVVTEATAEPERSEVDNEELERILLNRVPLTQYMSVIEDDTEP